METKYGVESAQNNFCKNAEEIGKHLVEYYITSNY